MLITVTDAKTAMANRMRYVLTYVPVATLSGPGMALMRKPPRE